MRALIFELRPGNLEQDGLTHALRTHASALQGRIGLPIVVESSLDERLPIAVEEVLYRISQEALHNVVKHAGARQVRLEVGRNTERRAPAHRRRRQGLRSRARRGRPPRAGRDARPGDKIDARFSCTSAPGHGTTIEVDVSNEALAAAGTIPALGSGGANRDG